MTVSKSFLISMKNKRKSDLEILRAQSEQSKTLERINRLDIQKKCVEISLINHILKVGH